MDNYINSSEYTNSLVFCLVKIIHNNDNNLNLLKERGIIIKICDSLDNYIYDESLIESVSTLFANVLISHDPGLWELNILDNIIKILDSFNSRENNQIILNCVLCINQMAATPSGIERIADSRFQEVFFETIERKSNNSEIVKFSTQLLGNYLAKEIGNNIKNMNFHKLIDYCNSLQQSFYYNSDVLTNINILAGCIIYNINEKNLKENLILLINESVKIQDWNVNLIQISLTLFIEIFDQNNCLIDNVFEEILLSCLNFLANHNDSEILILSCKILLIFSRNYIYMCVMVSKSLVQIIRSLMDKLDEIEKKDEIRELLFKIISLLIPEYHNAKKVSEELMNKFIYYSITAEFARSQKDLLVSKP